MSLKSTIQSHYPRQIRGSQRQEAEFPKPGRDPKNQKSRVRLRVLKGSGKGMSKQAEVQYRQDTAETGNPAGESFLREQTI